MTFQWTTADPSTTFSAGLNFAENQICDWHCHRVLLGREFRNSFFLCTLNSILLKCNFIPQDKTHGGAKVLIDFDISGLIQYFWL